MSIFCGNGIDVVDVKAPNGKPSILFDELLILFEGNQDQALSAYLQADSMSKDRVDENGEVNNEDTKAFLQNYINTYAAWVDKF